MNDHNNDIPINSRHLGSPRHSVLSSYADYWVNKWNQGQVVDYAAWRKYNSEQTANFLLSISGVSRSVITDFRIVCLGNAPLAPLQSIKSRLRVCCDPDILIFENLIPYPDDDPDIVNIAVELTQTNLKPAVFDLVFVNTNCPANQVQAILQEALRLTTPGGTLAVNIGIDSIVDVEQSLGIPVVDGYIRGSLKKPGALRSKATDLVRLHYPLTISPKWKIGKPHPIFDSIFTKNRVDYLRRLSNYKSHKSNYKAISWDYIDNKEPFWSNGWIPILDGISLYCEVADAKPDFFLEIGSGNSTKFVHRAIRDYGLATKIISIDPSPRAEIDEICTMTYRVGFESFNISELAFPKEKNVICYMDGSHYCFQNSDATAFFIDFLPTIPPTWLVGVHDMILPYDYLNDDMRFFNKQYLLAAFLLGGGVETILPLTYYSLDGEIMEKISDIMPEKTGDGSSWRGGAIFWLRNNMSFNGLVQTK
jgi:SAM-dependent methyltransferase